MTQVPAKQDAVEKLRNRFETWRIMKNVVIISIAFMLEFMAYNGAVNLQSSINAEGGVGTMALAAAYAGNIVSCLLLSATVIRLLGCKWGVSLMCLTYLPYIAAQLLPRFWTLAPTALLGGLGGAALWCSKCTYLSILSEAHEKISTVSAEVTLVRFFGIFYMIYQLNQVWGNLISSLVLTSGNNLAALTAVNATMVPEICGANFLPSADAEKAFQEQPAEKIQLITGIYLLCMAVASLLVAVGVDSTNRYAPLLNEDRKNPSSGASLLLVTVKLLMEPDMILMIPITVFIGVGEAFIASDFTAAFVSCVIGTGSVGFVMMSYGVVAAVGSLFVGYLAKMTGRPSIMMAALLVHTGIFVTLLAWKPQAHLPQVIYAIAVVWGICDSVWMVEVNSFYGTLFPGREQGAYAHYRLWECAGYMISYLASPGLRMSTKTCALLAIMVVGVAGYMNVEYRAHRLKRQKEAEAVGVCTKI